MTANVLAGSLLALLCVVAADDSSAQNRAPETFWSSVDTRSDADVARETAKLRRTDSSSRLAGQYIVVLKDAAVNALVGRGIARGVEEAVGVASRELVGRYGGRIDYEYAYALHGFLVSGIDDIKAGRIANDASVDYVEADQSVGLSQSVQMNPVWGLDRIDQRNLPLDNAYHYSGTGANVNVYVIDSGIHPHNDFGARLKSGFTAVNDGHGTDDCAGHGTWVAGLVGGTTYGVAKGVNLYPVRVFACSTTTSTSTIIAGINWVIPNHINPAVANMSLGGDPSSSEDTATRNLVASGVTTIVAAGNEAADACGVSPARVSEAITVGGTTIGDQMYSLSNFGQCVDVYAPGENLNSDYYTSSSATAVFSGTSGSAPHVAGFAALIKAGSPSATPATIAAQIRDSATTRKIVNAAEPTYCTNANPLVFTGTNPAPGAPTGQPSVAAERICNGNYRLSWGAIGSATTYELYKTESVRPGCEGYLISTGNTFINASVPTVGGSTTFRIRACNASGCGPYSLPKSISYYSGCQ